MFRAHRTPRTAAPLSERLESLPTGWLHAAFDEDHLVANPFGVFLLGEGERPYERAEELVLRANRLRSALAETLLFVPFIQPLVVARVEFPDVDPFRPPACPVVPPSLVLPTLHGGHVQVQPSVLEELRIACRHLDRQKDRLPDATAA